MRKRNKILWLFMILSLMFSICSVGAAPRNPLNDYSAVPLAYSKFKTDDDIFFKSFDGDLNKLPMLKFSGADASSYLTSDNIRYMPSKAIDGKKGTCWQEGVDGDGIGESIILKFSSPQIVSVIAIWPGNNAHFSANGRPAALEFVFSGGYSATCSFNDINGGYALELSHPICTEYIQIVIKDVYKGQWHEDTCISEVYAFGPEKDYNKTSSYGILYPISFKSCDSSSYLTSGNIRYVPTKAFDSNPGTCWQEGVDGYGKGEYIVAAFEKPVAIRALGIHPGNYCYYDANNRPKNIEIRFSNGDVSELMLPDDNCELVLRFPSDIVVEWVQIIIKDVYKGTWNDDTCITEIKAYVAS